MITIPARSECTLNLTTRGHVCYWWSIIRFRTIGKAFRDMEAYLKRQIEERRRETKAILENSSDLDQFAKDVFSRLVLANEQNQEGMNDLELVRHLNQLPLCIENLGEGNPC
jgi:cytochrome P450